MKNFKKWQRGLTFCYIFVFLLQMSFSGLLSTINYASAETIVEIETSACNILTALPTDPDCLALCGDGIKNGFEECDGTDGVGEHQTCSETCTLITLPYCTDGNVDPGEECDDGDTKHYNYCTNECKINVCGDGLHQTGVEECDDGNKIDGDGCSSDCKIEAPAPVCGDGAVNQTSEQCDDGNLVNNDGCSDTCQSEVPICGDNIKNGTEECDDGNVSNNDGCKNDCIINICGDGSKWNVIEQCDDGNLVNGDGCSADCKIETTPVCVLPGDIVIDEIMQNPSTATDANGEWFEIYNPKVTAINLNGCTISDAGTDSHLINTDLIVPAGGYTVLGRNGNTAINGNYTPNHVYGTNFTLANTDDEIIITCCDTEIDRVDYTGATPWPDPTGASMILNNPNLDNNDGANWCLSTSAFGNGDLGTPGTINDSCCGAGPFCGNGILESGEICDDGNTDNTDACLNNCTLPTCGDGYIWNGQETCDDNGNNGQICTPPYGGMCSYCADVCEPVNLDGPYCGDGIVNDPSEQCDNTAGVNPGEICSINCTLGNEPYCGDGIINNQEVCDDGNTFNTDDCLNTCELPTCGDGYLWTGQETCDDNGNNGQVCTPLYGGSCDYCANTCEPVHLTGPYCGDGIINDSSEECDDGNTENEDQCRNDCTCVGCVWFVGVMMIMDRSGSMGYDSPTRLSKAQTTANDFLNNLNVTDQSGLVSYANYATLDKTLSNNHSATQSAISSLTPFGATNIGDAIAAANNELISSRHNPDAVSIEILMTDGLANKPSGPGYGEYAPDVAYALTKATEAAAHGIKIFTIGIGTDINTAMLQQIADDTNGKYYFAPTASELADIFNQIGFDVCQYGSISGCKYNDLNNNGQIDPLEPTISNWPITLENNKTFTQNTDQSGCFKFTGVPLDSYTLREGNKVGVISLQTYPVGNYSINLTGPDDLTGYDFANYLPLCGNNILDTGYLDYPDEQCDLGALNGAPGSICNQDCTSYIPFCGDGLVNQTSELCDDGNDSNTDNCLNTCELPTCGDGYLWTGQEICDDNGQNDQVCIPEYGGSCDYCSDVCEPVHLTGPYCGDGIKNGGEECDGTDGVSDHYLCTQTCNLEYIPFCGDGIINQTSETCDDGNTNNNDNCLNNCTLPLCGDGIVSGNELCDDGNTLNTDDCLNTCELPTCGDGYLWTGQETCDDNGQNGIVCAPPYGGSCDYCANTCEPVHLTGPYCGDNIKNGSEQCDGTDGIGEHQTCSNTCTLENVPYCGDGIINQTNEQCDDGNNIDTDECKNDCTLPSLCKDEMDVMMVIDRSGSMTYSSRCDWWQLKCANKPLCTSYVWTLNTDYNQSKSWCDAKNQSAPHQSTWTAYDPVKILAAKQTANDFISLMGTGDQSGLVSFDTTVTLDKKLSNNHALTQTAITNLIPVGATNIGDAIKMATAELTSERINPLADQVMILLTDGKANKPSGPGFGEYAPDVAYAISQASEAAAAGIKIYTIGLDSEINAAMLQQIADLTGGQYYFAPTSNELADIFAALKLGVCGNEAFCGDGIKNGSEECDGTDGVGEHQICNTDCTLTNLPYCGDGIKNNQEQCDGIDGVGEHQSCSNTCTLENVGFCGDGIINGTEICDDGNLIDTDNCRNNCTLPSVCQSAIDIALVMDRSGSMGYTSECSWWQLKCANKPLCTSYVWTLNTTYNVTKSWCDAKNQSAPHQSTWTAYDPVKITAAKQTANDFISLMTTNDQSALISFASNVTLDKQLSSNHSLTGTAINSLITVGATNIGDAIKTATNELTSTRINPLADQVMILLTDGMANKPSGPGYGEYAPDVAYALAKAGEAAAAGIKIFTIGLGSDINATMLQQIADATGGEYYFAPSASDLDEIFDQLTAGVCQP